MASAYLSLGSNIDDRLHYINKAKSLIIGKIGRITSESGLYETEPWGFFDEKYFLNMVIRVRTALFYRDLLNEINKIEGTLGRKRTINKYVSRTIDIDILFYDEMVINEQGIIIPHPQLHNRKFVLIPLIDIEGDLVHPVFGKTIKELLEKCEDMSDVRKILF